MRRARGAAGRVPAVPCLRGRRPGPPGGPVRRVSERWSTRDRPVDVRPRDGPARAGARHRRQVETGLGCAFAGEWRADGHMTGTATGRSRQRVGARRWAGTPPLDQGERRADGDPLTRLRPAAGPRRRPRRTRRRSPALSVSTTATMSPRCTASPGATQPLERPCRRPCRRRATASGTRPSSAPTARARRRRRRRRPAAARPPRGAWRRHRHLGAADPRDRRVEVVEARPRRSGRAISADEAAAAPALVDDHGAVGAGAPTRGSVASSSGRSTRRSIDLGVDAVGGELRRRRRAPCASVPP